MPLSRLNRQRFNGGGGHKLSGWWFDHAQCRLPTYASTSSEQPGMVESMTLTKATACRFVAHSTPPGMGGWLSRPAVSRETHIVRIQELEFLVHGLDTCLQLSNLVVPFVCLWFVGTNQIGLPRLFARCESPGGTGSHQTASFTVDVWDVCVPLCRIDEHVQGQSCQSNLDNPQSKRKAWGVQSVCVASRKPRSECTIELGRHRSHHTRKWQTW